jgi:hypothetical protein
MHERESFWRISVNGYGTFAFFGTEQQAEEMRAHKACWERGVATKRRVPVSYHMCAELIERNAREADAGAQSAIDLRRRLENYLGVSV